MTETLTYCVVLLALKLTAKVAKRYSSTAPVEFTEAAQLVEASSAKL